MTRFLLLYNNIIYIPLVMHWNRQNSLILTILNLRSKSPQFCAHPFISFKIIFKSNNMWNNFRIYIASLIWPLYLMMWSVYYSMCGGDILGGWEKCQTIEGVDNHVCYRLLGDSKWYVCSAVASFLSTFSFCDDLIIKHGFSSLVGMSTSWIEKDICVYVCRCMYILPAT